MTKYVIEYESQFHKDYWVMLPHLYDTMTEAELAASYRHEKTRVKPMEMK